MDDLADVAAAFESMPSSGKRPASSFDAGTSAKRHSRRFDRPDGATPEQPTTAGHASAAETPNAGETGAATDEAGPTSMKTAATKAAEQATAKAVAAAAKHARLAAEMEAAKAESDRAAAEAAAAIEVREAEEKAASEAEIKAELLGSYAGVDAANERLEKAKAAAIARGMPTTRD